MNALLVLLPILLPLLTAILGLLARRSGRAQRALGVAGSAVLFLASVALLATVWRRGIQVVQLGSWPAPFGITFVADMLSALMVGVSGTIAMAVAVYSLAAIDLPREALGYHPLCQLLLLGVNGAFLTGDLFNLYVWFEVMLIASFALLVIGNARAQIRAALAYVAVNLVASALLLSAIALLYGTFGTLNLADLSRRLANDPPGVVTAISMLFLVAFGIKAAVFPVFTWLPASYPAPPMAVAALFAALLTKVGVYALIRMFTLLFVHDVGYTHQVLLAVAGLTMISGVLGAMIQTDVRRILSFHIVSQVGYMIMGLALFTPLGLLGAVFYVIHHIIVKANLFLIAGITDSVTGSFELGEMGGLYRTHPWLAALFLVPALSLAGVPPLSGFWAKLILVRAGLATGEYAIVAVALGVGLLTLFSMTKIWAQAFWADPPSGDPGPARLLPSTALIAPAIALAAITVMIGLWAVPLFEAAGRASGELLAPERYVRAVLGGAA